MPAPDGPQFHRFFHGTTYPFKEGDVVLPVSQRGVNPLHDETDADYAYATRDVQSARFWADKASEKQKLEGEPRVYGVEPLERDIKQDMHSLNDDDVRSSAGWRVVGEVTDFDDDEEDE